ncbi:HIRA-interacting protein 3 [Pseudonaja textilis]|uniref:HIRA-interacting protein 3 n=1 Tax=Pseudonaja textilis TaxID=8673 RepID=UPI000EA8A254|nr:HIRA-interacting protein 3 [Pseudonaja textilis]
MKVDQPPSNVELRTEAQESINHNRPIPISFRSEDEIENEKKQKRQNIEKKLEVSSDEMDSEIDSKKRLGCRSLKLLIFSDSSNQQDSGAGNHSTESESDEETTRSKRKPSLQEARWKRGGGRKPPESQGIGGSQKRRVNESEEIIDTGQSDLEEEVKEYRKVTKGNGLKQRDEKNLSKGGTDLSEVEEISEKKREWSESEKEEKKSFRTNKAQQRMGPGTQEDSEGNESEDTSGSGPDEKFNLQKKMAGSQRRRKSRVVEDLGSSSEDSANQCPGREEGAKRARGESGNQQTENHSKPKRQPKVTAGRKKMQREDLLRKKPEEVKKMMQRIQDSPSEGSESESREHKSSEEKKKKKWVQDPTSSEGESQSEMNQGQSRKAATTSLLSESESNENEDGDPGRTLEKKNKDVSGSDSSQGGEELKKRGAQKSRRKSMDQETSALSSEDFESEFNGKKKRQSQRQRRTKKRQRGSATKEKPGERSSLVGDKPTTTQQHLHGKDKKHHSGKNEKHPFIQRLKRYIWECGAHRNYKKLLADCHSHKARIKALKEELESLGVKGPPSLAKCKAIKQKREEAAEMASLDINNIIFTEGRPKRRKVWSLYNKPQESPSSPEELTFRRHTTDWSQLQGVISSDGESS